MNKHSGFRPLPVLVERPRDPPDTRLIPHRQAQPDDHRILSMIESLPRVSREGDRVLAGICNRAGEVYREVQLEGPLEYIIFAARMNAAGYAHESVIPARKGAYGVVFRKVMKRPLTC